MWCFSTPDVPWWKVHSDGIATWRRAWPGCSATIGHTVFPRSILDQICSPRPSIMHCVRPAVHQIRRWYSLLSRLRATLQLFITSWLPWVVAFIVNFLLTSSRRWHCSKLLEKKKQQQHIYKNESLFLNRSVLNSLGIGIPESIISRTLNSINTGIGHITLFKGWCKFALLFLLVLKPEVQVSWFYTVFAKFSCSPNA